MSSHTNSLVSFDDAVDLLRRGEVCAFGTETVYGLGADAADSDAVLKIYETKNRPRFNPLIAHVSDFEMAQELVEFGSVAAELVKFWPGALTLVLPRRPNANISDLVTAGLDTLAIRMPAREQARNLIKAVGRPIAAPSANPSGKLSPTSAEMVLAGFGGRVPVLDTGPSELGLESTILAVLDEPIVQLRAGGLAREEIEAKTGRSVETADSDQPVSAPGMLKSHYAPRASMRLDARERIEGEVMLGFGDVVPKPNLNLSASGDLREAASNLFAYLAQLDEMAHGQIAVAPIPNTGLGEAINDRLVRAAAPRDQ